ncbi:MAG: choice-of-anchor D domain-containing protein [Acidobacteriaceae bacterium]|nr:choice-of-anchor D domain-containing protein [Acidobacteriaceae bacterium]
MKLEHWPLLALLTALAVRAQTPPDTISTYAGGGPNNVPAIQANVPYPLNTATDSAGNFYIVMGAPAHGVPLEYVYKVNSSGTLTVVAGTGSTNGSPPQLTPTASASLNNPNAVAVDSSGNIYIADTQANIVLEVAAGTGLVSRFAGGGDGSSNKATDSTLSQPYGVAVDSAGNVYIADTGDEEIRKVTASTGDMSTFAGKGSAGYGGDGGQATNAYLNNPYGVAVDSAGNVYIADQDNYRIRKVTASTGIISTIAGNGTSGYSGNGVAGPSAEISTVDGIASDASGNVFIADTGNCVVREVKAATGIITTVAGTPGQCGFSGDGGLSTSAKLNSAYGVSVDKSDNMYIADFQNLRVRKAALGGKISTVAGNGLLHYTAGSTALEAALYLPQSATVDSSGDVYIADTGNCVVRKVAAETGDISTIAGTPDSCGYGGDGGAATSALLNDPTKAILDSSGNLYISDELNCAIRKITASTGDISTVAGTPGSCGYSGNGGAATSAELNQPTGIAFDASGNLYIADQGNAVVRKVAAATQEITTVAGNHAANPDRVFSGGGGPATSASLVQPWDVALDAQGNLYIADSGDSGVFIVNPSGIINPFAGGTDGFNGDGLALQCYLARPMGVGVDPAGDVLIGDTYNDRVRWVDRQGMLHTIAGSSGTNGNIGLGDGQPATQGVLGLPAGVATDSSGNIYIGDTQDNRIRLVTAIANVNASTYSLIFAPQLQGSPSSPQTITLTGVGASTISSITATGDFAQTNNCPGSLASGASCTINVTFTPTAEGTRTGTLVVNTNGFFNPSFTIKLQGASGLIYSPSIVYFGGAKVGTTTSVQTLTFTNDSAAAITFSSATTSSTNFTIVSNTCTGSIAKGKTCTIGMNFKPTTSGAASGTLTVKDSDNSSPQSIALHGTGIATSISPASLAFGTVPAGTGKTLTTTVTNLGTGPLTGFAGNLSGSGDSDYTFTTTCGATLAGGASCTFSVTFRPWQKVPYSATLGIQNNEKTYPGWPVPLSGTGG